MRFTKIPEDTFKNIQLNSGIILNTFDPETVPESAAILAAIMGATSGGTTFNATPSYSDYGDDIDNCPKNTMELKKLESWEVKMSGTFVTVTAATTASMLGAADVSGNKITPRNDLTDADFKDVWWVGDYSDKNGEDNGGFVAIHMMNALSTAGFQLKTSDKAKGQFSFEFTAHYSIADQDTVPFEVYVMAGTDSAA